MKPVLNLVEMELDMDAVELDEIERIKGTASDS
jgi:hypothetical protein